MGIRYQQEPFADFLKDALPLLARHWLEVAHYPDIPLAIDAVKYQACEDAGLLYIYTARDGLKNTLVGYAVFLVGSNSHYCTSGIQAKQDVIYVDQDRRGAFIGIRLIKFADSMLKHLGVQVAMQHVKLAHPMLGKILVRLGYEPIETIYAKRLDLQTERAVSDSEQANADLPETALTHAEHA